MEAHRAFKALRIHRQVVGDGGVLEHLYLAAGVDLEVGAEQVGAIEDAGLQGEGVAVGAGVTDRVEGGRDPLDQGRVGVRSPGELVGGFDDLVTAGF